MKTKKKNSAVEEPQILTPGELIQIIQQLAARTPVIDPVADVSIWTRRKLMRVDQEVVQASLNAMHSTAEVQAALGRNDADVTAESTNASTWSVAIDVARQYVNGLEATNGRRFERVGLTALQTYGICRQLVRDHRHSQTLTPHVVEMKRLFRRRRTKKASSPAPQQQ